MPQSKHLRRGVFADGHAQPKVYPKPISSGWTLACGKRGGREKRRMREKKEE